MRDLLDRMGAALLDGSLAATAIAGLVVLAMIQCRQPARRRDWARAGLLSTLALLPLAALNPVPRIDLRETLRSVLATNLDGPPPGAGPGAGSIPTIDDSVRPDCPGGESRPVGPNDRAPWPRRIARGFVLVYLGGASIGLGGIALGIAGSTWLVRMARTPSISSLAMHRSLPFGRSWRRPRLLVSDRVTRPVLVGSISPVILIPPALDEPSSGERLRLSLLHELAHAESLDHLFALLAALAKAIWFYLPPVWWVLDQMKLDQEFLADRRAVVHFGTSGGYASSLVDLASPSGESLAPDQPSAVAELAGPRREGVASTLFHRVSMLVRCPFDLEGRTPLWWRWSTALTLAVATLAASCLTVRGLAGWSGAADTPAARVAGSYRQPDLMIAQRPNDDQPFDLRFRLPDRFVLTFEILAEPSDLPGIEVLGHRLGVGRQPDPARQAYRLWHRVRIERLEGAETIEVDARTIPADPSPVRLATWLTIRPSPGMTTRLRDLELVW